MIDVSEHDRDLPGRGVVDVRAIVYVYTLGLQVAGVAPLWRERVVLRAVDIPHRTRGSGQTATASTASLPRNRADGFHSQLAARSSPCAATSAIPSLSTAARQTRALSVS